MNILVTGAKGILGARLVAYLATQGFAVTGLNSRALDVTDYGAAVRVIGAAHPDLVIHCAALTRVDYAAEHPAEALRVNGYGAHNVALACAQSGAALAFISSNEVFDGSSPRPYLEYDRTAPANPYGYSKWYAEEAIQRILPQHYIIRTSWLFAHGGSNFLQKILMRAGAGEALHVVTDEVAAPTYGEDLVVAICALIQTQRYGIYHLVNEGSASRYAFARAALDAAGYAHFSIEGITHEQFPRPSRPPRDSTLANFAAAALGIRLRPWQHAVEAFIEAERAASTARP